jgi:hypothetical protein
LDAGKAVARITLPSHPNLEVLAIDLVKTGGQALASTTTGLARNPISANSSRSTAPIVKVRGIVSVPRIPIDYSGKSDIQLGPIAYGWMPQVADHWLSLCAVHKKLD